MSGILKLGLLTLTSIISSIKVSCLLIDRLFIDIDRLFSEASGADSNARHRPTDRPETEAHGRALNGKGSIMDGQRRTEEDADLYVRHRKAASGE